MSQKSPLHKPKMVQLDRMRQYPWWAIARAQFTMKRVLGFFAVAAILGFFGVTLFIAWLTRDLPDPNNLQDRTVVESTKMYDRTGEHLIYEIYDEKKRTVVDISKVPAYVVNATIAIEDNHFYEHNGVRWQSIVRAIFSDILHLSSGRGGASTLTQQLVKNAILTNEHSLSRKVKEAILALEIEREYSKQQILTLYFNEIPYGSTNYGIEAASKSYYDKSAKDLTVAEAATLASLVQLPTHYLQNPMALSNRRDYTLGKMKEYGYITDAQYQEAIAQSTEIKQIHKSSIAPHFVMYLKEQLVKQFGEKTVDQGGLKVVTTLDYDLQIAANDAIKAGVDAAEKKYNATNGALLAMDPKTGDILAMVGSRDFSDNAHGGQFNVTTQGIRQPGSSFKPIVYTAAFEKGFTPDTVFFDTETDFPYDGRVYHPHNYDGKEHGPVTMRQALQGSLNIPAVKTVFLVGMDRALDFADRLGYTTMTDRSQFGPSVVLGGGGVKMIEHVRAYGVFANGGSVVEPSGFVKIEDRRGNDLTPKRKDGKQVIDAALTATISNVLSDNAARSYVFGAKNYLTLSDRPVAVKTGTTNDYHDAWTVGYMPQIVTGVWVGNNDNATMKRGADGSIVAAPIWQTFMKAAAKKFPVQNFPTPPENTATNPMLRGATGGVSIAIDTVSGLRATSDTPAEVTQMRTFVPPHDILYYVNSDNPMGPAPTDPGSNSQFAAWEAGVQQWIAKHVADGIVFGEPPTESDNVHTQENRPTVDLMFPQSGYIFTGSEITAQVSASAPRGIARVEFYIDGVLVSSLNVAPFTLSYPASIIKPGNHVLKVTVFDDVSNAASREASFINHPDSAAPTGVAPMLPN